jgi:hypothetical protein
MSALLLLVALLSCSVLAGEVVRTVTAEGDCERLLIQDEDLTDECGTPLVQMQEADGRLAVSAGTGGMAWFGLADPERLVLFYGAGNGQDWTDHPVDQVVVHDHATNANVTVQPATGACIYRDADPGLRVTCAAEDAEGKRYALTYRTDGRPGLRF